MTFSYFPTSCANISAFARWIFFKFLVTTKINQHCCSASWNFLLRVLPPAWPTLSRNKIRCCKLRRHVAKNRLEFYFLQQILVLLLVLPLKLQIVSQQIWLQGLWLAVSEARLPGYPYFKRKLARLIIQYRDVLFSNISLYCIISLSNFRLLLNLLLIRSSTARGSGTSILLRWSLQKLTS